MDLAGRRKVRGLIKWGLAALLGYVGYNAVSSGGILTDAVLQILFTGMFLIFFVGFQMFLFGYFMSRSKFSVFMPGDKGVPTLDNYWGQPKITEVVQQWVALFKDPATYRKIGGKMPRGALLTGRPGTGKTWLARCLAGSSGVPMLYMDASSLQSAWMGMGNINIMLKARKARKLAADYGVCLFYFDEIDAIGASRFSGGQPRTGLGMMMGGMGGGSSGLLSTLLHEMDGSMDHGLVDRMWFRVLSWLGYEVPKERRGVVFWMGSTNIPDVLDPALTRAGRLNRTIQIDMPDRNGRKEILEGYLKTIRLVDTRLTHHNLPKPGDITTQYPVDLDRLVDETGEMTPADIRMLITEEAPRKAHFSGFTAVGMGDFEEALTEVHVGIRNPISDLDPKEEEAIAVHESGHALLAWVLTDRRLQNVTVVRYGDALGHVLPIETRGRTIRKLNELWADLVVSIGGRAAEIMVYGEPMKSVGGDYPAVMHRISQLLEGGLWGTPVGTLRENSIRTRHMFEHALQTAIALLEERKAQHWKLVEGLTTSTSKRLSHEQITELLGERERVHVPNPVEPGHVKEGRNGTDRG